MVSAVTSDAHTHLSSLRYTISNLDCESSLDLHTQTRAPVLSIELVSRSAAWDHSAENSAGSGTSFNDVWK